MLDAGISLMQYLVAINQVKAVEWGLNAQQAMLFAFLHQVPTWANARQIDGHTYFNIGKGKICEELPLLTDKHDTAYRLMKQLAKLDLIVMTSCDNRTYMRLTEKGVTWGRSTGSEKSPIRPSAPDSQGSEKNPTSEKSPRGVGKISVPGSEKSPTNQGTNDPNPSLSGAGEPSIFERAAQQADNGQPQATAGARQVPMTLDWQPDATYWQTETVRRGQPDLTWDAAELADFTSHFADQPGRYHSSHAWCTRFVRWVSENRKREAARQARMSQNANTSSNNTARNVGGTHGSRRSTGPIRNSKLSAAEGRALIEQRRREQAEGQPPSGDVIDGEWL